MLTIAACILHLPSKQPPSLKVIHSFIRSFIPLFVCMGAQRSQKRAIGVLELEIKEVVRLITWVLATKLKSSACEPSFQLLTHLSRPQIPFFLGGLFYFFMCMYVHTNVCLCCSVKQSMAVWLTPPLLSASQKLDHSHVLCGLFVSWILAAGSGYSVFWPKVLELS